VARGTTRYGSARCPASVLSHVPFADGEPHRQSLQGGGDPAFHSYYPAFLPTNKLIAFTRAPALVSSYDNPAAEIFVLPREGGACPDRLAANDSAPCASYERAPD